MNRELIKNKFGGMCAYTGKPLGDDWQIDHIQPKCNGGQNDIENLIPAIKIINHYKRSFGLEGFREYMSSFHNRLSKLPKNPKSPKGIRHKQYLLEVARLFDINPQKPFNGTFYFENYKNEKEKI